MDVTAAPSHNLPVTGLIIGIVVVGCIWYLTSQKFSRNDNGSQSMERWWKESSILDGSNGNYSNIGNDDEKRSNKGKIHPTKVNTERMIRNDIGRSWTEINESDICPTGCKFKMDFETGKNYARRL